MTVDQQLRSSARRIRAAADEIPVPEVADLVGMKRRRPLLLVAATIAVVAAMAGAVLALTSRDVTESVATEPSVPESTAPPVEEITYDPDHLDMVMRSAPEFAGAESISELTRLERAEDPSVVPLVYAGVRGPFFTDYWGLATGGSYTVTTVRPDDLEILLANLTHERRPTIVDDPEPGTLRWAPEVVGDLWVVSWEHPRGDMAIVVTATAEVTLEFLDSILASVHTTGAEPMSTNGYVENGVYRGVWVLDDVAWVDSLAGPTALDAVIGTPALLEIAGGLLGSEEHGGRRYLSHAVVDRDGYSNFTRRIGEIESFPAFDALSVVNNPDWQVSFGPLSLLDEPGEETYVFGIAPEGSVAIRLVFEDGSVVEAGLDQPAYGVSSIFVPVDPSPTDYDPIAIDALDASGAVLAIWRADA